MWCRLLTCARLVSRLGERVNNPPQVANLPHIGTLSMGRRLDSEELVRSSDGPSPSWLRGIRAHVCVPGPMPVAGQAPKKWTARRTPDGQPDLQGIWSNATITPLERPNELAGKAFLTEQEAAEYEKRIVEGGNRDRRGSDAASDLRGAYNEAWFDRGTKV